MLENRKIFVVEDEGKIRDELTKFLKQYGYLVEISTDFKNMVSNILESNPHIVLLDITLPY